MSTDLSKGEIRSGVDVGTIITIIETVVKSNTVLPL